MVITHNMCAENAQRQYKITEAEKARSTEKLSSGYKINRSADDAAGLSISEKMRRLIRGLDQGSENIQDGISLCQVADGALAEVTSVLQRVRELSIQAYNGTNSKSDRACIQDEVDSCLLEVDEIKERTKFNDIYILKGNQHIDEAQFVKVEEPYLVTSYKLEERYLPDWIKINDGGDKRIELHSYDFQTDTNDIMYADYTYKDDSGKEQVVSLYFGAPKGNTLRKYGKDYAYIESFVKNNTGKDSYQKLLDQNQQLAEYITKSFDTSNHYTGWTNTSADNVSCKLDFGGLIDEVRSAAGSKTDALFTSMFNLLGCEIGFPCGTCSDVNAIQFSGSIDGWMTNYFATETAYQSSSDLSLSENPFVWKQFTAGPGGSLTESQHTYTGYFDAIIGLYSIENEAVRDRKAEELAREIAVDLTERMKDSLSQQMESHFDRVASDNDPANDTILYVYDYRDNSALLTPADADSRVLNLTSAVWRTYTYEDTREVYAEKEKNRTFGLKIHCSTNTYDSIPLLLQEISRDSLNITDYSVNHYSIKETFQYGLYEKEMAAWREKLKNQPYKIVTEQIQSTKIVKPPKWEVRSVNGEWRSVCVEKGEFEPGEIITVEKKVPAGNVPPRPRLKSTAEEIYDPSPLALIDEAIATVSALRSYFGANQNRLEHAYANNENAAENLQAAESKIRDTDMTEEAINHSLHNILEQAGQTMMAQANQMHQGVLNLLQ